MACKVSLRAVAVVCLTFITFLGFASRARAQTATQRANLSPDVYTLVGGNTQFALNLYQRVAAESRADANVLVSPFSISSALTMTYAGARGNTAAQMANVLGFTLPDDRLHPAYGELLSDLTTPRDAYQLNVANRLFGQQGYPFEQPFLDVTANDYQAPLEPTNFVGDPEGSRQQINQWVSDQTKGKIPDLMPKGSVTTDTRLVLTNAIYFNGQWKYAFDESQTAARPFYSADGSFALAATMFQVGFFRYGQFDGYQMLEMPYTGDDLSMVVMLPTANNGLGDLEGSLTAATLSADLGQMSYSDVDISLPKFKFDAAFELSKTLQAMGMTDAFDSHAANFSGIVAPDVDQLFINTVLHKASIDVNEAGTVAAAATGVGVGDNAVEPPPQIFNANHPFLFALRDTHSGSLLFMGRVMQPGDAAITSLGVPSVPEPSSSVLLAIAAVGVTAYRLRRPIRQRCGPAHSS
jgi:serpin B